MEFGWINLFGGIMVVLILIPNIAYALKKRGHDDGKSIPKALGVCEQIGRYACMILMWLPLLVWKFGFGSPAEFVLYLLLNGVLLLAYYLGWLRYFKKPGLKTAMALAILPTLVFLTSGLLLRHWLLAAAAILFGISHGMITYITHAENNMRKLFEINGCIEVQPELTEDKFWNIFIGFVEANGWYFGGGWKEIIQRGGPMRKLFDIDGTIEVQPEVTEEEFMDRFLGFVEANGWSFGGWTAQIIDDYYILPDGSRGPHVLEGQSPAKKCAGLILTEEDKRLHDLSFENEESLLASSKCGCYYCGRIFAPSEVTEWINDRHGRTALCPYCGVDAVLHEPDDGAYTVDDTLLIRMNHLWFGLNGETFGITKA